MTIKQFLSEIQRFQCNLMNIDITIHVIKKENGFVSIYVTVLNNKRSTKVLVTDKDTESNIHNKYILIINALNIID